MTRHGRDTRLISVPVAILAVIALATSANAAGLSWSKPVVLGSGSVVDAAFSGENAAILWGNAQGVRVRTSANGGASFARATLFPWSGSAYRGAGKVAICGDDVYAVYEANDGADLVIKLAHGQAGGRLTNVTTVADGPGERVRADVACTDSRVFVSWYERESEADPFSMYFSSALTDGGPFDPPTDLGVSPACCNALAASENTVYAFYQLADGKLQLARWAIGSAPDHELSFLGSRVVVAGGSDEYVGSPIIAAVGDTVAVAWSRCFSTYVRVSSDSGATWEPARRIYQIGCEAVDAGTTPVALAIDGNRMALTWVISGLGGGRAYLERTSNAFTSRTRTGLGNDQDHIVGFLTINGRTRLVDTFSTSDKVKFRPQQ